jgi:predicted RNA methylase
MPARHVINFGGRRFENDYVFPAEIAALRARKTGKFQEEVILQWIRGQKLKGTYIDVGAHIGNHSLFFAAFCPSTKVLSIEGHPRIRELLKGNLKRNLKKDEIEKVAIAEAAAWFESNARVRFAPPPRS